MEGLRLPLPADQPLPVVALGQDRVRDLEGHPRAGQGVRRRHGGGRGHAGEGQGLPERGTVARAARDARGRGADLLHVQRERAPPHHRPRTQDLGQRGQQIRVYFLAQGHRGGQQQRRARARVHDPLRRHRVHLPPHASPRGRLLLPLQTRSELG